jgi:acetyltransferase
MIPGATTGGPRPTAYELITLRPPVPADGPGLRALCEAQAPRELAWLAGGTMSPSDFARGACEPRGISLVVLRGEGGHPEPVGLARLCIDPGGVAGEFAILVAMSARGRGFGRMLLERLLADCRRRGLLLLRASSLPGNAAMLALARACRFQLLPAADGTIELVQALAPCAEARR